MGKSKSKCPAGGAESVVAFLVSYSTARDKETVKAIFFDKNEKSLVMSHMSNDVIDV